MVLDTLDKLSTNLESIRWTPLKEQFPMKHELETSLLNPETLGRTETIGENRRGTFRAAAQLLMLLTAFFALERNAAAQQYTSITLGVQQSYDDNVFLENDERIPVPLVANAALEEDIQDGSLSVFAGDENDGKPDDDFITNVFLSMATQFPQVQKYADVNVEGTVGALFFAEVENQDRLTLDGKLRANLSKEILPEPFYLGAGATLESQSNNASVAEGTAARASETLTANWRGGIERYQILERTTFDLGYLGAYRTFLGELRFSDVEDGQEEEEGADYHTHTAVTGLDYSVNDRLTVGISGSVGVQLYLSADSNDLLKTGAEDEEDSLDRTNADVAFETSYIASERLTFAGSVGVGFSSLHDEPGPREVTFIKKNGDAETVIIQPGSSDSSLTFSGNMGYNFAPGSTASLGLAQEITNDLDGDRIFTRSVFANLTKAFGDRFSLTLAGTYNEFSSDSSLSRSTQRFDASASGTLALTQNLSLVFGYNYITQNAEDDDLEEQLRFQSNDYEVNRVYVTLNAGLVGLPL